MVKLIIFYYIYTKGLLDNFALFMYCLELRCTLCGLWIIFKGEKIEEHVSNAISLQKMKRN